MLFFKKMADELPPKNYKIDRDVADPFDAMAKKNRRSGPLAITELMEAGLEYAEQYQGKFPSPVRIVSELEYQQFLAYKELRDADFNVKSGGTAEEIA